MQLLLDLAIIIGKASILLIPTKMALFGHLRCSGGKRSLCIVGNTVVL